MGIIVIFLILAEVPGVVRRISEALEQKILMKKKNNFNFLGFVTPRVLKGSFKRD